MSPRGTIREWRRGPCRRPRAPRRGVPLPRALLPGVLLLAAFTALAPAPAVAQRIVTLTDDVTGGDRVALGYPVPKPVASLTAVDGFRTYESLLARYQELALASPAIQGHTVGSTRKGRPIMAYLLGDADALTAGGQPEPSAMLVAGVHAREWQPPEVLAELYETLAAGGEDGGLGQYLSENLSLVMVPVANPDGFLQAQRYYDRVTSPAGTYTPRDGRLRRKNLYTTDEVLATFGDRLNGVDLNRNHPPFFEQGSSALPTHILYRGPFPHSEPENQALLAAAQLAPAERLRFYLDCHSYSQVYLSSDTPSGRRNDLAARLATRMRAVNRYKYGLRTTPVGQGLGASSIYFAWTYEIPSFTLEVEPQASSAQYGGNGVFGDGFILPEAEIARVRGELIPALLLALYHQAGPPAVRAVQVAEIGGGVVFDAAWVPAEGGASRRLEKRVDAPLVPGRTYRLWVAFDKPMRHRDGGAVVDYPGQNVQLAPAVRLVGTGADGAPLAVGVPTSADAWRSGPGGAPDGALRYATDAFAADFTVPADLPVGNGVELALEIRTTDMARLALDADPSTPVDWADGGWAGYEDEAGQAGDDGGVDRTLRLRVAPPSATEPCAPGPETLCLLDGRFAAQVTWRNPRNGAAGSGGALPGSSGTGYFWFFDRGALELIVKVVDGRQLNGHFWFFYGALSDVEYTLRITDTATGRVRLYTNPAGNLCGRGDTDAFPAASGDEAVAAREGLARPPGPGAMGPGAMGRRAATGCPPDGETLCLLGERFEVRVGWHNPRSGRRGTARAVVRSDETGLFWFFDPDAVELVVKMVDGRGANGHFWFFYGALSDVEYTLRVSDTATGAERTYRNPPGEICGRADTSAF